MDVIPIADLHAGGLRPRDIQRRVSAGELTRVMRGHYLHEHVDDVARHLALAHCLPPGHVLALETAALVHGLSLASVPTMVQTVEDGAGRSRRQSRRVVMTAPLPTHHVTTLDGFSLTTRARTVVDIARLRGLEAGFISWESARWDAGRRQGLEQFDACAADVVECLAGRTGIGWARQALQRASALSQSPMETRSLLRMSALGLPIPVQQFSVVNWSGKSLGLTDFAWPDRGVLGEYDGQDKYDRLARPGESPRDVVRREKRRQESMEALGWVFARWGKEELAHPRAFRDRVEAAFRIAALRGAPLPGVPG